MGKILDKINSPNDLKKLDKASLNLLTGELREVLLNYLSNHGGHIGPNLGVVELSIALHYVFNSPTDKIIFDVSHQCYVHKILTGRKLYFTEKEHFGEVTGFLEPFESVHDLFRLGHTSTSISLLNGLQKSRDIKGGKENVIAVIGDGSLSGGEAYEGLNNVISTGSNAIIIVNDNEMSISENHGGIYNNLKKLRETNGEYNNNFFKSLGFSYYYLEEGNNLSSLIEILSKIKDTTTPTVLHIHTLKGKGYRYAVENKEKFHSGGPFDLKTGEFLSKSSISYTDTTMDYLLNRMKLDKNIALITSGTPSYFFKNKEDRDNLYNNYVDVGIAEEHAVAMASSMAKNDIKSIYLVASSFLQRAYDQIIIDLCLNNNPSVILNFMASIYGMKSCTHLGFFDIAMLSHIPNLLYLSPTNNEEYIKMLSMSIEQKKRVIAIRVPVFPFVEKSKYYDVNTISFDKSKVAIYGDTVLVIGVGNFFSIAEKVIEKLKGDLNIQGTLVNPIFLTGVDEGLYSKLKQNHKIVVTIEDGILEGGYSERIASFYAKDEIKVLSFGIKKKFYNNYKIEDIIKDNHLRVEDIIKEIKKELLFI